MKGLFIYNDGRQVMEPVPAAPGIDGRPRPPRVMQRWEAPDLVGSYKDFLDEVPEPLTTLTFRHTGEMVCTMFPVYQEDP